MAKDQGETKQGTVSEALPNTLFRVMIGDQEILAYLSGKMRMHRIKILVGDKVDVLLDPYGGKGRITRRMSPQGGLAFFLIVVYYLPR